MNKEGLLELTKNALGLETKKEAEGFLKEVDALMEALSNGLEIGTKVKVGKYIEVAKVHKEATTARNPKTGESIAVPEKDVVKVKALKALNK